MSKHFEGLAAVEMVNFRVEQGRVAGLIGPNGSGKTTLFNLLSGLFLPTRGKVIFQGKDITKSAPHKRVGMGITRTFQLVSVFNSLTAWENLVLSNIKSKEKHRTVRNFYFVSAQNKRVQEDCLAALELVGLQEKAAVQTSELSYGDKRMLEIAIGLSLKPTLLLLDEPLAGLSDHEIGGVLDIIHRVKENFTLAIIDHKISKIINLVDSLSVMNYGRIICEGHPEQVLSHPAVRECYWGKEENGCST
ncbi:MAG: ATP-binding cassette domain-containing protein [Deltaproteobacteria bacterium]|nr:ATP-binding cassette domain-containing protein [Deltaproteobacteria bacterium]